MQALSHRSWCAEHPGSPSNERLEFLGDAVLGLVVTDHIYRSYPELPEGELAKLRASVVDAVSLADVARGLGIGPALRLGRGEDSSGGRAKPSILADALEAVIGAVYLHQGRGGATALVTRLLGAKIEEAASGPGFNDAKTRLQEAAARWSFEPPRYEVVHFGPDHDRRFRAKVLVGDRCLGVGEGTSKKRAEQSAARAALDSSAGETQSARLA